MSWWAVYSQPGRALLARDELSACALGQVFCPVERLTHKRKIPNRNQYRAHKVTAPLFGRYFFAEADQVVDVLSARGVSDVVRSGEKPLEVSGRLLARVLQLREMTAWVDGVGHLIGTRDLTKLSLGFTGKVGDRFVFSGGGLTGFSGVIRSLERLNGAGEVGVTVEMFGGSRDIKVSHAVVRPLPVNSVETRQAA